jgi:tripartite-type tricarboxylate transporter receptor subunit TctC
VNKYRLCLLIATLPFAAHLAHAVDAYPGKPIRIIVPMAAGASTDLLTRAVARVYTEAFQQQVVVDNRAGAGGIIGSEMAAKAPNDGYTLMMAASGTLTINPSIYRKLPYDPVRDFVPISLTSYAPLVIAVNASSPAHAVGDLIAMAKARPAQLTFGTAGTGTMQHLAGELFKFLAKVDMVHVPYKGGAPAMISLLSGEVSLMFVQVASAAPHVKTGKLRALATGSPRRVSVFPELPTAAEAGVPGYDSDGWYGLVAPAGVSGDLVQKLNTAITKGLQVKETQEQLSGAGFVLAGSTPGEFTKIIKEDITKWARVLKAAGIRAE